MEAAACKYNNIEAAIALLEWTGPNGKQVELGENLDSLMNASLGHEARLLKVLYPRVKDALEKVTSAPKHDQIESNVSDIRRELQSSQELLEEFGASIDHLKGELEKLKDRQTEILDIKFKSVSGQDIESVMQELESNSGIYLMPSCLILVQPLFLYLLK